MCEQQNRNDRQDRVNELTRLFSLAAETTFFPDLEVSRTPSQVGNSPYRGESPDNSGNIGGSSDDSARDSDYASFSSSSSDSSSEDSDYSYTRKKRRVTKKGNSRIQRIKQRTPDATRNEMIDFIASKVHGYNNMTTSKSVRYFWKAIAAHLNSNNHSLPLNRSSHRQYTATSVESMWNEACERHPDSEIYVQCQPKATTNVHTLVYIEYSGGVSLNHSIHTARWARDWYIKHLYQQPREVYTAYTTYLQRKAETYKRVEQIADTANTVLLMMLTSIEFADTGYADVSENDILTVQQRNTLPPVYIRNINNLWIRVTKGRLPLAQSKLNEEKKQIEQMNEKKQMKQETPKSRVQVSTAKLGTTHNTGRSVSKRVNTTPAHDPPPPVSAHSCSNSVLLNATPCVVAYDNNFIVPEYKYAIAPQPASADDNYW